MSASGQINVFATLTAAPGKEDEMRGVLQELVAETRKEPGVIDYILNEDLRKPGSFLFFESYKDDAAVEAHKTSAHIAAAFGKLGPLLAGAPSIIATKPL